MPEIDGKQVKFRESMPARLWWELWPKVAGIGKEDVIYETLGWEGSVQLCQAVIESWEFDGDPADAATYEALDFIPMLTLTVAAYHHVVTFTNRIVETAGE